MIAPTTKLPFYDLLSDGHRTNSACAQHHICSSSTPVQENRQNILRAFAAFVAAVVEQENVAFVAEYTSLTAAGEAQVNRQLVIASTKMANKRQTYNSEYVSLVFEDADSVNEGEIDFSIRLFAPDSEATESKVATHIQVFALINSIH